MTGPKLNEKATEVEQSTRAVARYVRVSAFKAREVLDLIRGLDVRRADEVLAFTTRDVAHDVRKVLASAVANAVNNDGQDVDELFVLACYADEGPTMKRFRPRARGRGTRIRKRSCHITVVVARLGDDRLDVVQGRRAGGTGRGAASSAAGRRDRVARSRARAEGLRSGDDTATPDQSDAADTSVQGFASIEASAEGDLPAGAVAAPEDGSAPEGYPIKGNANSMKYHVPEGRYYDATVAEIYFDTVEHAEAAGYEAPAADEAAVEEFAETEVEADADTTSVQGFAAVDAEAEAADADETSEIELPAGAAAPLADGSAPEGFPIKGNASSKKYHVPGGRYFDVTVAELYFDTAENAEAAGYEQPAADQENN